MRNDETYIKGVAPHLVAQYVGKAIGGEYRTFGTLESGRSR
jgi:hypothetical protein